MNSLVRWRPFREMAAMQNALDRMFEEGWRPFFEEGDVLNANPLALDVHEDDTTYTVVTELPGVKPENINVKIEGDILMIDGEIPEQVVEREGQRTLMKERRYGRFSRRLRLPRRVNSGQVEASYNDGVLTLKLPKSEESQPKQIPIKVGNNT